jgi:hypothetical protein
MDGDVDEQSDNIARIDSSEAEHVLAAQATNQRQERGRVLQYEHKPNFAGSSRRVVLVTRAVARRGPETKQGRKQCPEGNMDITREETMADWRGSWIYAACTLCMEGNFDHQYPCIVYGRPTYLAGLYFREHMCINVCPETYYILGSQPLGFGTVLMSFVNSFSLKNHTHKE